MIFPSNQSLLLKAERENNNLELLNILELDFSRIAFLQETNKKIGNR